ncbi:hypothetical protein C8Q75DRAFT_783049 [Abortiporus biennis]|nr:hypothetical protein C8Q75DRAFT_783049 [Abortiporus biennis]
MLSLKLPTRVPSRCTCQIIFRVPLGRQPRYRMSSTQSRTSLQHPHELFSLSNSPPPPSLLCAKYLSPQLIMNAQESFLLHFTERTGNQKRLAAALQEFQNNLRSAHIRRIYWPDATAFDLETSSSPSEYLRTLLQPIADIFNQLHTVYVLKTPMKCVSVDLGNDVVGVTFTADDFTRWKATFHPPLIVFIPDNLFESNGTLTCEAKYAVSKALEYYLKLPGVIVSNFKDTVIFFPENSKRTEFSYEKVVSSRPIQALQVVTGAYMYQFLPYNSAFIHVVDDWYGPTRDRALILPQGPPQDPHQPLQPDEEIFANCHRNSDFDQVTLSRDRERALQLFRWRKHVASQYSKVVAHPGDVLLAATDDTSSIPLHGCLHPVYPFELSQLPPETVKHLTSIERISPLSVDGTDKLLQQSKSFKLQIGDVLYEGSKHGFCTVYVCQITEIDGKPISSPVNLCLKLFDDRFQYLETPEDEQDMEDLEPFLVLSSDVIIAESNALTEALAYDKLRPVQGSIVPWFYGLHKFTLPNGLVLYGILMEYIDGWALSSNNAKNLSDERQDKVIESCRHATRVLDMADITQFDWHPGQILIHTNPSTKVDHCVLIDFAITNQTWSSIVPNWTINYMEMIRVVFDKKAGLKPDLIWKHFAEPDEWDPIRLSVPIFPGSKETRELKARNMFPYIFTEG